MRTRRVANGNEGTGGGATQRTPVKTQTRRLAHKGMGEMAMVGANTTPPAVASGGGGGSEANANQSPNMCKWCGCRGGGGAVHVPTGTKTKETSISKNRQKTNKKKDPTT